MTHRLLPSLLLLVLPAFAAHAEDSAQMQALREINNDVWAPFVRGVNSYDHPLYSQVRAKDSIFVDGKLLFDYAAYVDDALKVMESMRAAGTRIDMQVRFGQRVSDGRHASERGLLRSVVTDASGKQRIFHAHFHVISRKQADGWRIVTDYRWRTGAEADARAFETAQPMDALEPFR